MSRAAARLAPILLVACARIGTPPGGPADRAPPVLTGVYPDSTAILPGFDDDAEFQFDEIIAEGSQPNFGFGTGDLERLIVLSPTDRVPNVRWKRRRITVKPREGWQPNRVYRVELLAGVVDLRSNRSRTGRVITFTTGAPVPARFITGRVVDWTTARPQVGALVEATLMPDSLVYRTAADSSGRFSFGPLPDGEFLVAGVLDQNSNHRRDGREAFDSVRIAAGRDSVGELWAFRHDTVATRIQTAQLGDSVSIVVGFTQHLNPYQRLPADSVRVLALPDSTPVPVLAILPKEGYDSLFAPPPAVDTTAVVPDSAALARADSVRAARAAAARARIAVPIDTVDREPLTSRPVLFDRLIIRVGQPLRPGGRYVVEIRGIENANRVAGTAVQGLQVPAAAPHPDSTAADSAVADSAAAVRPDSVAAPPDPARPPPSPPPPPPAAIRRPRR